MRIAKISAKKVVIYYQSPMPKRDSKEFGLEDAIKRIEKGETEEEEENNESCQEKNKELIPGGLIDNKVKGVLSLKARQRLRESVSKLVNAYTIGELGRVWALFKSRVKLTFITLTLSSEQVHSDYVIKREMLGRFLEWLQREKGVTAYVWRAEVQKNNNIHFHILANRRIMWQDIRKKWNELQGKLGYIQAYREKMSKLSQADYIRMRGAKTMKEIANAIKNYAEGVRSYWSNPNSTDIHSINNMKNIEAYISKYMSKEEEKEVRKIKGHLWGRSDSIELMSICRVVLNNNDEKILSNLVNKGTIKEFSQEWFKVFVFQKTDVFRERFSFLNFFDITCQNNFCIAEGRNYYQEKIKLM